MFTAPDDTTRRDHFNTSLLSWYDQQARDLPWRTNPTPYRVWISEMMLQQTQVTTVLPYFERWMERFPTIEALANANQESVLKVWEGLGYYARARNLHRAAQQIVAEYGGELPTTAEALLKLPGIGAYTAGAIASIAFGQKAAALDANLKRILARVVACEKPINTPAGEKALWEVANSLVPDERAGDWNQALMDVGATICLARTPRCLLCPVREFCVAQKEGRTDELPRKVAKAPRPHYIVVAGVIWDSAQKQLLIAQRPQDKMLGGLWEFPGGKIEGEETLQVGLQRELREELDIEVEVGELLTIVEHGYTHFSITLHALHCTYLSGEPKALGVADFRWIDPSDLRALPFPRTDLQIIAALEKALEGRDRNRETTTDVSHKVG